VKVYETELDLANQSEDQYQIDKARLKFCAAKVLEANQNSFNEYQDWCYQLIQQYIEMVKDESINKESLTIIIGSKAITIDRDCRLNKSTSHAFVKVTDLYLA
jgi:hypothetical protein